MNFIIGLAVSFTSNTDKGTNKKNPDIRSTATVTGLTVISFYIIKVLQT